MEWRKSVPMAKLPATIDDAEALTHARELIEMMRNWNDFSFLGIDVGPPLVSDAGQRWARDFFKAWAYRHIDNLAVIADGARQGWGLADEILREMFREMTARGEINHYLNAYISDVTRGVIPRRPAQRKETHFFRDTFVACMVLVVGEKFGLRPTRNPATQRRASACSIVAQAMNMSEPAVVAIWRKTGKSL